LTPLPILPLTPERAEQAASRFVESLGRSSSGARLLKFTNNAVVALPAAGLVLRIAGSQNARSKIPVVLTVAELFVERGLAAVRLWEGCAQPVELDGGALATVWRLVPAGGAEPRPADLAEILRAVHALEDVDHLPAWMPMRGIRRRLREADGVDVETLAQLADIADELEDDLRAMQVAPLIPAGLIHGDVHLGNLIGSPNGPVICDFDSTSVGPREWDLVPAAVGAIRFDYRFPVHDEFAAAYGTDVTGWAGFPVFRRLRELQLVTSVLPVLAGNPLLHRQWRHRVSTLSAAHEGDPWTPYAEL
jgi:hypothetical protein